MNSDNQNIDLGLSAPLMQVPKVYRRPSTDPNAVGDAAGGLNYVFTEELALAVNVALATRRPLLLRGAPGSGKSTLARALAGVRDCDFLLKVVTSDSRLDDLLWRYDHVRRMQDASDRDRHIQDDHEYVDPEMLWWALAPESAKGRGKANRKLKRPVSSPLSRPNQAPVLLLDEIDKADPALPNDLLVALGEGKFTIRETGEEVVAEHAPLIVITTNEERELSRPFMRRCIVVELATPAARELREWLVEVGGAHFPDQSPLIEELASFMTGPAVEPPSAAEFVDLLRACVELSVTVNHARFTTMRRLVADKSRLGARD
jgi:MoxR-like ATPase